MLRRGAHTAGYRPGRLGTAMALGVLLLAHRTWCDTTPRRSPTSSRGGTTYQMSIASNSTTWHIITDLLQIKMRKLKQRRIRHHQQPSAPAPTPAQAVPKHNGCLSAADGEACMATTGSERAHGNVLDQEQLDLEERGNAQTEPRLRRRRHHDSLRDGQRRPGGHS